jgi:hypothetical protein
MRTFDLRGMTSGCAVFEHRSRVDHAVLRHRRHTLSAMPCARLSTPGGLKFEAGSGVHFHA